MGKERRQLNISAPLLSVRKHLYPRTSAALTVEILTEKKPPGAQFSLLVDRSAGESEQVTEPVAVPFLWEKTPGRPKRDCFDPSDEGPAITPRLPPGRLFEVGTPRTPHGRLHNTRNLSGETCCSSKLFLPGKIFGEKSSPSPRPGRLVDVKPMAGRVGTKQTSGGNSRMQNDSKCQGEVFTTTGHTSLLERLNESLDSDGDSDDEFSDALDTLYPNDSLSVDSSSVSGLSSSYHENCGSSGNFAADLQYRDFMMSRFLPEAKAAVMHMPQYVAKNQKVVFGKIAKKVIPSERKPLLKQKGLNARPSSNQHMDYLETEDEDMEYDDPKTRMGKTCGIFRPLCAFGSHSRSKSWMKLKTQRSETSSEDVKQLTRNSYRGPVDKYSYDAVSRKLYPSEVASQELPRVGNKFTGESKRMSFPSCKMADGPSLFPKDARFCGLPKPLEPKTDKITPPVEGDKPVVEVPARS